MKVSELILILIVLVLLVLGVEYYLTQKLDNQVCVHTCQQLR